MSPNTTTPACLAPLLLLSSPGGAAPAGLDVAGVFSDRAGLPASPFCSDLDLLL